MAQIPPLSALFAVTVYVVIVAAGILGGTGGAGLLTRDTHDSERNISSLPMLMHFPSPNFTAADMEVLKGVTIHHQDGNRATFNNADFTSIGNLTMKPSKNGTAHGDLTISITRDGEERIDHGKWIVVDTSDGSGADNETIEAFGKLLEQMGATGEKIALNMMRLVEDVTERVADELQG